jgi:hypothetical protein
VVVLAAANAFADSGGNVVADGGFEQPRVAATQTCSPGARIGPRPVDAGTVQLVRGGAYAGAQYIPLGLGARISEPATLVSRRYGLLFAIEGLCPGTGGNLGHDAWVVGDEPVVRFEIESRTAEVYGTG